MNQMNYRLRKTVSSHLDQYHASVRTGKHYCSSRIGYTAINSEIRRYSCPNLSLNELFLQINNSYSTLASHVTSRTNSYSSNYAQTDHSVFAIQDSNSDLSVSHSRDQTNVFARACSERLDYTRHFKLKRTLSHNPELCPRFLAPHGFSSFISGSSLPIVSHFDHRFYSISDHIHPDDIFECYGDPDHAHKERLDILEMKSMDWQYIIDLM